MSRKVLGRGLDALIPRPVATQVTPPPAPRVRARYGVGGAHSPESLATPQHF